MNESLLKVRSFVGRAFSDQERTILTITRSETSQLVTSLKNETLPEVAGIVELESSYFQNRWKGNHPQTGSSEIWQDFDFSTLPGAKILQAIPTVNIAAGNKNSRLRNISELALMGVPHILEVEKYLSDPTGTISELKIPRKSNGSNLSQSHILIDEVESDALSFLHRLPANSVNVTVEALSSNMVATSAYANALCLSLTKVIPKGGFLFTQNSPAIWELLSGADFEEIPPESYGGSTGYTDLFEKIVVYQKKLEADPLSQIS